MNRWTTPIWIHLVSMLIPLCSLISCVRLSSLMLFCLSTSSFIPLPDEVQYLIDLDLVFYTSCLLTLVLLFPCLLSGRYFSGAKKEMMRNVLWHLYSMCVWLISRPSNKMFRSFAGPHMFWLRAVWESLHSRVHCLSQFVFICAIHCTWLFISFVGSVFILVVFHARYIAVLAGSISTCGVVLGLRHSVNEYWIWNLIVAPCDGIWPCSYHCE